MAHIDSPFMDSATPIIEITISPRTALEIYSIELQI